MTNCMKPDDIKKNAARDHVLHRSEPNPSMPRRLPI